MNSTKSAIPFFSALNVDFFLKIIPHRGKEVRRKCKFDTRKFLKNNKEPF